MTIWAELYDAGTMMLIDPLQTTPGMDYGYYREIDMEYTWPGEFQTRINTAIRSTALEGQFRPWPEPFPWRMWIDQTPRYEGEDGGFKFNLFHWDNFHDVYNPVPSDLAQIESSAAYEPNVLRRFERTTRPQTADEISATASPGEPTPWLRTTLYNEPGGGQGSTCELLKPAVITFDNLPGYAHKFHLDYNPLFMPMKMSEPDWYDFIDSEGNPVAVGEKAHIFNLLEKGYYRLYLRPANWRWVATVWANYWYVSWFESFPTRLVYTTAWFNRPPVYPKRHDLIHTTQVALEEYLGNLYSTDSGIDYGFNSSRGAAFLRHQIIDAQWWTLSEAFIFTGNDPATLVLWLWPPEAGDIVMGLGEVDTDTGAEQVMWVVQNRDLTSEFPRTVIGNYIIYDFVVAD
jgi:hypothetical protein